MSPVPDIGGNQSWLAFLASLGVNVDAIKAQLAAYAASHPDAAAGVAFAEGLLNDHLGPTVLTALAQQAANELWDAIQTGSGPIPDHTSPTDFA